MEVLSRTVAPPLEKELLFLLGGQKPERDFKRIRQAAIASAAVHLILIFWLWKIPPEAPTHPPEPEVARRVTHLVDPPTELTQRAPNRAKLSKELAIEAIQPHPEVRKPTPAPVTRRAMAPPPAAVIPNQQPKQVPQIQPPEPPKVETSARNAPALPGVPLPQAAPPPPPQNSAPKLAFETPTAPPKSSGPANPNLVSSNPVQDAMRNVVRSGELGRQRVGDSVPGLEAPGPGISLPPSPGRPQSDLELKSDPMGVDFKPYLIRVLATVRRNWFAIYPEAARLGQRGMVKVEFAVAKDGSIPKVTYAEQSGSRPLDEAAVAALSASNPLPPLPAEFKGQRVVLEFTFTYNMPKR